LRLELLRHHDSQIRADACRCAGAQQEAAATLIELLDDLHRYVAAAAACALERAGRSQVRPFLLRSLREKTLHGTDRCNRPASRRGSIILLGRVAHARPDLAQAVLDALDAIDHPRAEKIAAQIRKR